MQARQRQALILRTAETDGSVKTSELQRLLGVSTMTVRRDLEILAERGLMEKVHGGAALPGWPYAHKTWPEAESIFERRGVTSIARTAAGLVEPGTVIALTGGTTTFRLAQYLLGAEGLTIVTNSLPVASLFKGGRDPARTPVIVTGGVRTPTGALVGPAANLSIESLRFGTVFVGCSGIDPRTGLTTPDLAEAETNRRFAQVARQVVVLADHSKWGATSMAPFLDLDQVDVLVTDRAVPPEVRPAASQKIGRILT